MTDEQMRYPDRQIRSPSFLILPEDKRKYGSSEIRNLPGQST
jgi:hypothetical protein